MFVLNFCDSDILPLNVQSDKGWQAATGQNRPCRTGFALQNSFALFSHIMIFSEAIIISICKYKTMYDKGPNKNKSGQLPGKLA